MTRLTDDIILQALSRVMDPDRAADVVTLGMISGLNINPAGEVLFIITVDPARGPKLETLRQQAEQAVLNIPGVTKVTAILTAERSPVSAPASASASAASDPHGMNKNPRLDHLPIRHIIVVASGKGGVGKSTVAANLAVALAQAGYKTGLLDADIYGPSQPLMMGLRGRKPPQQNNKIEPLIAHGVKVVSIGFMVDSEAPLVWRGPMVQTAIYQLLRDVNWGSPQDPLDILVVDMPPGTGDAQLTMAQKVPLAGAVIVSTPQDIALIDARKGLEMFRKVNVPVLGLIENMSVYICPSCGHADHIFGHGGAKAEAARLQCPFLGEIPLHKDIRILGDNGTPITAAQPDSPYAQAFAQIARVIARALPLAQAA